MSLEKYGIKKFTEKYYIPYNTAENYNFRKFGTDINNGTNRLMTRSWTKRTVKGANTPIVADDLTAVWSAHVSEMAQYSAFALTLDSMEQIFNYRTVQPDGKTGRVSSIISTYYGQKYMDYFTTFMTDLNGKSYADSRDGTFTRLLSKSKKAAVMLSLSVAVQQMTSYFRAMQELGVTSMLVLVDYEEELEKVLTSLQTVNTAIEKRLSTLGFSDATSEDLYEAYENNTLAEFAKKHPIVASALTVASNLGSALQTGDTVAAALQGKQEESEAYTAQKVSTLWRSAAAEEFSEWYKAHPTVVSDLIDKGLGFLGAEDAGVYFYNTMMSAADDLARTGMISLLTMGMGTGAKAAQKLVKALSTAVASSSALSTSFVQEIENGESAGDALLSSLIGAVAEGASEYLSLELIFKDGGKSLLKKLHRTHFLKAVKKWSGKSLKQGLICSF